MEHLQICLNFYPETWEYVFLTHISFERVVQTPSRWSLNVVFVQDYQMKKNALKSR